MLSVPKVLVFFFVLRSTTSDEAFKFSTEKDFFKFVEKWTRSESVEDFRRIQSKFMKQLMDASVDPCENFNDYACGNLSSIAPPDLFRSTIGASMSFTKFISFENILRDHIENETEISVKLNSFHRSCMNYDAWKPEVAGNIIRNFADWPILHNERYEKEFDWIKTTARASMHGCSTLFRHKMIERNGTFYDSIGPVWLPAPALEDLNNYSTSVGIDLTGKGYELSELLSFLNDLHKLISDDIYAIEEEFHTISDLQKLYPEFDILRFLQIKRDPEAISADTVVHIYRPIHFRKLNDLITSTDNVIVANAIFAKIVTELLPPRTEEFLKRRKELCTRFALMPFQVDLMIQFVDKYLGQDTRENVEHLTMDIVEAADHLNPQKKVYNIEKEIFYPLRSNFTHAFMDFYRQVEINPDDFYSNYFNTVTTSVRLQTKYADRMRVLANSYRRYPRIYGIVVPITLLVPPFYHKYSADYVKFGALGSYVGHQIYRETSADIDAYESSIECLYLYYYNSTRNTAECAATEGLKISVTAYKNWMKLNHVQESTDIQVNGKFLDALQGLFLSHAQSICTTGNEDSKRAISKAYSNLPAFKDAFHCHEPNLPFKSHKENLIY